MKRFIFILLPCLLALFQISIDFPRLDKYDILLLMCLSAFAAWAILTKIRSVRIIILAIFSAVNIFTVMDYEPSARSATSDRTSIHTTTFADGIAAMLHEIVPYRPYVIVSTLALFLIGALPIRSSYSKDMGPEQQSKRPAS